MRIAFKMWVITFKIRNTMKMNFVNKTSMSGVIPGLW